MIREYSTSATAGDGDILFLCFPAASQAAATCWLTAAACHRWFAPTQAATSLARLPPNHPVVRLCTLEASADPAPMLTDATAAPLTCPFRRAASPQRAEALAV